MENNGYDLDLANNAVALGEGDLVAFGRRIIVNPDRVERIAQNLELNELDSETLYGGGAAGYTDYPAHKAIFTA